MKDTQIKLQQKITNRLPGLLCALVGGLMFWPLIGFAQTGPAAERMPTSLRQSIQTALARSQNVRELLWTEPEPQQVLPLPGEAALTLWGPQSGRKPAPGAGPAVPAQPLPPLSLDDVLRIVEQNHPKLRGAAVQREIAAAKRLEKQGAFDPVLSLGNDYLRFNSTTTRGKLAETAISGAAVEFQTRYGIKVAAGTRFNLGRVKSPLSSTGDAGEYFVEFKVPLLRGARLNEKAAAERQAWLGEPLAETDYALARLDLLFKAANSYWDWVAAQRKLQVARSLLNLAEFRAKAVKERVQAGDLPQIDSVEAELEIQRRQGNLVKGERELQKAALKLSLYLWTPDGQQSLSPEPSQVPTTFAQPALFTDQQALEGQKFALERRPELRALMLNRQITQVDLDLARNQRQPGLDLTFSPGRDTGFGAIGTTFKGGLTFSLPLRQRTADGRIGAASLKIQKLELDTLNERQRITTEVADALSAINTAYERYRAAAREAELAQRLEEGERIKFQLGDSTLFLVNQRERATAEAQVKLIEIQAEYEQAVATFRTVSVQY
jgi:outer membrane protein